MLDKLIPVLLKSLGATVAPEHIKALENIIPQIPAKANQLLHYVNNKVSDFESRIEANERKLDRLIEMLEARKEPKQDEVKPN
jgi:hypothetical protein